jgi:hypothetical protein
MVENIRNASVAVGVSSVIVAPRLFSGQRRVLCLTNTSTGGQIITISTGKEATALSGIVLYPAGSWSESIDAAFIPSNLEFWAIGSAASGTLAVQERIETLGG